MRVIAGAELHERYGFVCACEVCAKASCFDLLSADEIRLLLVPWLDAMSRSNFAGTCAVHRQAAAEASCEQRLAAEQAEQRRAAEQQRELARYAAEGTIAPAIREQERTGGWWVPATPSECKSDLHAAQLRLILGFLQSERLTEHCPLRLEAGRVPEAIAATFEVFVCFSLKER